MTQAVHEDDPRLHMGVPLPHGKLAMWLFLVTEIMFFTALIGTYVLLRNGTTPVFRAEVDDKGNPKKDNKGKEIMTREAWPKPHDVHLIEWVGAVNTFVLICSSVTVVLAHFALGKGNTRLALQYVGATLALGSVFLIIKAIEYKSKIDHDILPGHMGEALPGLKPEQERDFLNASRNYVARVKEQLEAITEDPDASA